MKDAFQVQSTLCSTESGTVAKSVLHQAIRGATYVHTYMRCTHAWCIYIYTYIKMCEKQMYMCIYIYIYIWYIWFIYIYISVKEQWRRSSLWREPLRPRSMAGWLRNSCLSNSNSKSNSNTYIYIYIYIGREREKKRERHTYMYT